ncbi:MAG: imidazole glycerol phosphate synthase subunit HisF [Rhodospirillales bacterium]|nr:imidazole glycerol phosphate synthase subunit HisF [Rhodospirillales bacterium]
MLCKRVIPVLTFNDGVLFRTKTFVPDYRYTLDFVDAWSADEIVVLDVTRPGAGERANFEAVVSEFARRCFVPLSAGGGVRSLDDVRRLMAIGADKVVVNTGAFERPALVGEIARRYGVQCVVGCVDARKTDAGYEAMVGFGARSTGLSAEAWAQRLEADGAGEILVQSIERDGSLQGYDIELARRVRAAVRVPVLVASGAGNWKHFADAFRDADVDAACTTNIYHFTETSIASAKMYLSGAGIPVRIS